MPVDDEENEIECPYCGKMASMLLNRCPECGQSFYPEDEPGTNNSRPVQKKSEGLVLRVVAFVVIGALLGSGLGLVIGPGWVWVTLIGAVLFGLLGMSGEWLH
jgi:hypothetical protein